MNPPNEQPSTDRLRVAEQRVLWLATRIVDAANRPRSATRTRASCSG
jgi:hypothetical protein